MFAEKRFLFSEWNKESIVLLCFFWIYGHSFNSFGYNLYRGLPYCYSWSVIFWIFRKSNRAHWSLCRVMWILMQWCTIWRNYFNYGIKIIRRWRSGRCWIRAGRRSHFFVYNFSKAYHSLCWEKRNSTHNGKLLVGWINITLFISSILEKYRNFATQLQNEYATI